MHNVFIQRKGLWEYALLTRYIEILFSFLFLFFSLVLFWFWMCFFFSVSIEKYWIRSELCCTPHAFNFFFPFLSECNTGRYGRGCFKHCNSRCAGPSNACHRFTGACTHGCDPGYRGAKCEQSKLLVHMFPSNWINIGTRRNCGRWGGGLTQIKCIDYFNKRKFAKKGFSVHYYP